MRCTSSPTSACTASAPIAPAARTSIRRGATATPESPSPARSTPAPGRRQRSARRPGRDHRQRRPDGRRHKPHRDAARHHQHRVVCQVPVFAKSASASENSLIGSGRSLSVENNYGYQDPFGPHTGAITRLRLRAGRHQQARQRLRAGVDKPHREPPSVGTETLHDNLARTARCGASASGADQPRAHGSTSPPPRLSPPPLSCHLARSRETAPPGDSGHKIRARRAPDMRPEPGKTRTCASTNAGLA